MNRAARHRIDRAARLCGLRSDELRHAEVPTGRADSEIAVLGLRDYLVCPNCREDLAWRADRATCLMCATEYPIIDDVPLLWSSHGEVQSNTHKQQQARFFDAADAEFEISRPHGTPWLYRWLLAQKFRQSLSGITSVPDGAIAAAVCGGSGMDAEFLARTGANVISLDISLGAARRARTRARRYGVAILAVVADTEALPLRDGSVHLAYVHDGLHHLETPSTGLAEMARISRCAVSVNEPAEAIVTRAAIRLRLSVETEEAGNRVNRVRSREIVASLEEHGLRIVKRKRYAMVYRHKPGRMARLLSRAPLRICIRTAFPLLNAIFAPFGNKLTVQAIRQTGSPCSH